MSKLHVDTDIGGDIDDFCALAMVINWPASELAGITTVADDRGRRAGYVHYTLRVAGLLHVPVAAGADVSMGVYQHWHPGFHHDESAYWPDLVSSAPASAGNALDLLERSIKEGATIAAIGPCTNLALLERRSPGILANASLVLMGGFVFPPRPGLPQWGRELDYNMQVDPESARTVLECADPVLVTLSVTLETALRRAWLEKIRRAGQMGQLVARQAEAFAREEDMESRYGQSCSAVPNDIINFLHDPLACAIALGWDDAVEIQELPVKSEIKDGYIWQTVDTGGKPTKVVRRVNGARFSEFWLETVCIPQRGRR